ncbi:hypothetical protein BJ875DRAFT_439455 [Amylocarpus encephaloides]|uniref:Kinesin light chain n=1 Tax=Amylocarpus encephaloides TaxID=45428 RepID=A0A9P8C775_9HELO|nr:hypothetical protein BJ875DRAFT_439455 [Amylocarpus encephaloides]
MGLAELGRISGHRRPKVESRKVGEFYLHNLSTWSTIPETWVFWVHASNTVRSDQSFRNIANCVKISGRQNPQADIFQLLHDWLRDDKKGKWVLILDNADDAGFLVEARRTGQDGQTSGIESGNSCKSASLKVVEPRDIIIVGPMNGADGLALFEKKLGWRDDGEDVDELAAVLEYMPLAIVQAAACVSYKVPRYSVRQYLQDFRRSDYKKTSLLNCDGEQLHRDQEAKNSIITTWQISFDHIREIRPTAADLLSLMSFFDRQGIPEALLRSRDEQSQHDQKNNNDDNHTNIDARHSDNDEDKGSQSSMNDRLEDDLLALRNYSFISALFPHAQSAVAQKPKEQDSLADWASVLYKAAWYAWRMGKGVEAEKMSVQAMKERKKILGDKHKDTLVMVMVQVMETRKKKLGTDHLDTLTSITNLASTFWDQGRWDATEELDVQVMETCKKKLGADHLDTLTSISNLASTYQNQGRWDVAEELEVQVIETLTSINNLAFTWKRTGKETEALRLMEECVQFRKRGLGLNHQYYISSCTYLDIWKAEQEDVVLSIRTIEDR